MKETSQFNSEDLTPSQRREAAYFWEAVEAGTIVEPEVEVCKYFMTLRARQPYKVGTFGEIMASFVQVFVGRRGGIEYSSRSLGKTFKAKGRDGRYWFRRFLEDGYAR